VLLEPPGFIPAKKRTQKIVISSENPPYGVRTHFVRTHGGFESRNLLFALAGPPVIPT
jgi:hypothetical protein